MSDASSISAVVHPRLWLKASGYRGQSQPACLVRPGEKLGRRAFKSLIAGNEVEFARLSSLRILQRLNLRMAAFLEALIRLPPMSSPLLVSVSDAGRSFCAFNHARRLNAFMQMQNTFAGIKPYCEVCNPITHTIRLLSPETTRPVHIFRPTRIVARTVRRHDR
jgi:hypothetical protein